MSARKYFIVSHDRNKSLPGLILINESTISTSGDPTFVLRDSSVRGFPPTKEVPYIKYIKSRGRKPKEFEKFRDFWLITNRVKEFLESVDAEAFVFMSCRTCIEGHESDGEYWICDVVRTINALDELKSDISIDYVGGKKLYNLIGSERYLFLEEKIQSNIIFRMQFAWHKVICNDIFREKCQKKQIKGLTFINCGR
ncbi:imm11 family protein [Methylobacterium sp. Leaf118]|uniref:imm11 family protein n=1 Tax=Methylobacterium sp. Leaf118 TaxID=2876562 RepID=UPI001E37C844|nr:DUF1629 domain-containing protein [Methylobacterium sp. Leaf118]